MQPSSKDTHKNETNRKIKCASLQVLTGSEFNIDIDRRQFGYEILQDKGDGHFDDTFR